MSKCDNFKVKIQAIIDGEMTINDKELSETFLHLSSCRDCRDEYHQLLKLKNTLNVNGVEEPTEEWFSEIERSKRFKLVRNVGLVLLLIPFLLLMGGSIWEMVHSSNELLIIKVSVITMILGVFILLGYTIAGKIKENKNDKYREIVR